MIIDLQQPAPNTIIRIDGKQIWPPFYPLNWKLTLPVDATGGNTGRAAEVLPLMSNYQNAPFFTQADGVMNFMAPVDGATTSGSSYPRCELRELNSDASLAAWTVTDGKRHAMSADCTINELPVVAGGKPGIVTIAQIHGQKQELCGLQSNGQFYDDAGNGVDPVTGEPRMKRFPLLSSANKALPPFAVGVPFSWSIVVDKGVQTVSVVMNGVTYSASEPVNAFWNPDKFYFKAGSYCQVGKDPKQTTGSGRASVTQGNVKVMHG